MSSDGSDLPGFAERSSRDSPATDSRVAAPEGYSIAELFRAHHRYVARFLKYAGVPFSDLDDLVQEVFLVAHRKGFQPGPATPRTWLTRIAVRVVSGFRRSKRRNPEHADADALGRVRDDEPSPLRSVQAQQALERVQRCLGALTEKERTVFVLADIMGESGDAIAGLLEVPVGTVYRRLHAARKRFQKAHAALPGEE